MNSYVWEVQREKEKSDTIHRGGLCKDRKKVIRVVEEVWPLMKRWGKILGGVQNTSGDPEKES